MKRCILLALLVQVELYPAACEMLDGTYWQESVHDQRADESPSSTDPHFWE